jgi:hypothetical protein
VTTTSARAAVPLPPGAAIRLWTDVRRWPTFVDGFGHALEVSPDWPAVGARVVWEARTGGRGRVTERVVESGGDRFATRMFEKALVGTQLLRVADGGEGTEVELTLDYELARYGPLRVLADAFFVRRAIRGGLSRTLFRFAVEAEEEAGLR